MSRWRRAAAVLAARADAVADRLHARVRRAAGYRHPLSVVPYLGYGTPGRVCVSGRVLAQRDYAPATAADTRWRNAVRFLRDLESDEMPGATVRAAMGAVTAEALSDAEGYVAFELATPPLPPGWHEVTLTVLAPRPGMPATGRVLVPPPSARYGVISDIDDTVVVSGVDRKLRMLLSLIVSNHHTRAPFEGVAAFYRALHAGVGGAEGNPLFYVSSSPWNLYTPLIDFLTLHRIPVGPLHLKDYGEHIAFAASDHAAHKLEAIERVLATYPALPFVLVGDSGEQDPEIYREVVRRHPGRVRVVYIREVGSAPDRAAAIDALAAEVRAAGSELVLVPDSVSAAVHAAAAGLIAAEALPGIRAERASDAAAPEPV